VDLIPETASALTSWTADMIFIRSAMNGDGTESLTWRSPRAFGAAPREQLRCRMVLAP
jgi:hypothetical protein